MEYFRTWNSHDGDIIIECRKDDTILCIGVERGGGMYYSITSQPIVDGDAVRLHHRDGCGWIRDGITIRKLCKRAGF